jgi:TfoX N-terminal domain
MATAGPRAMQWRKSPDSLVKVFDHSLPIVDGVERRPKFGYACAFFNGHLFCGLHGDGIIVLLPEARRDALVAQGASLFEPVHGQPMKEYVVVPTEIVADRRKLRELLTDALAHVSSLAPRPDEPSPARGKARPKRKALARKTAPPKKASSGKQTPTGKARSRKAAPAKKATKKKATRKASPKKKRASRSKT